MSDRRRPWFSGFFTADQRRLSWIAYLFLTVLACMFFMPGLVGIPPTDRDESLFAQASKQMVETGNFIDIRIQDEPRYKKPIGIYWLQAASVKLFSGSDLKAIWAYRLPSFLAAVTAVLITAALGSLLFSPAIGFAAAVMMAGCLILNVEARQAKTDATLLACIMAMQYALASAYMRQSSRWATPILFWTALGFGILVKGPIIVLVAISTLIWLRITEKNIAWFRALRPVPGIALMLLITMPWMIAIGLASHGDFFRKSAGHDMLGKVLNGEFRGMMPPGLHLIAFPLVFFPFSLFAILAAPDAWAARSNKSVRFCLGWIIPTWIVFELSLTKLPHYTLPTYPAIAMLAAKALDEGFPALAERRFRWIPPVMISVWLMIGTAIALAMLILPSNLENDWSGLQAAAGGVLLLAQGATLFLLLRRRIDSVLTMAVGNLIFIACTFSITLPKLDHLWISRQVVELADQVKPCPRLQIVSADYNEPSFIFLAGTDVELVPNGMMAAAEIYADPCKVAVIDAEHADFFRDAFGDEDEKPKALGHVIGFNAGRGKPIEMTLYTMP